MTPNAGVNAGAPRVATFHGDIVAAPAEVICTSTNARLTLMMGTGGAVREAGGFEVLRACEDILARSGRTQLPAGSAHVTTAGKLPYKAVIHCVASDPASHLSSDSIIKACVKNALKRADELHAQSVAVPLFGTGHARFKKERALAAMNEALRETETNVKDVVIVLG